MEAAMQVLIPWCANPSFPIKRIVISSRLAEAFAFFCEARRLGLPFVSDDRQIAPKSGDLWVGLCPQNGYGDIVGECAEARSCEEKIVLDRLRNALVR